MGKIRLELLKERYKYDEGRLLLKESRGNRASGDAVGSLDNRGYLTTKVNGRPVKVHRIIYALHHNEWPPVVDHVDGNPLNNAVENLRAATQQQNVYNTAKRKLGKSGYRGVSWKDDMKSWQVRVASSGKTYVWFFKDREAAALVAREARERLHGEFANHG